MSELDFPDYNLKFIDSEDGKEYMGKRIAGDRYGILIDPTLGLKEYFTTFKFKKRFISDVSNRRYRNNDARKCKSIFHFQ